MPKKYQKKSLNLKKVSKIKISQKVQKYQKYISYLIVQIAEVSVRVSHFSQLYASLGYSKLLIIDRLLIVGNSWIAWPNELTSIPINSKINDSSLRFVKGLYLGLESVIAI